MSGREIQFIDFKLAFLEVWRAKFIIIAVTFAGLFAGLLYTATKANDYVYSAMSSVYCATFTTGTYNNFGVETMINYSDVVTSQKVCEYAASIVGDARVTAEAIQSMISVSYSSTSYVMDIWATDEDQQLSMDVANAVAQAFTSEMSNITDNESVQVLDTATSTVTENLNSVNKTRLMFMMGAFMLATAYVCIKSLLSDKVKSVAQIAEFEDELLGIIPKME